MSKDPNVAQSQQEDDLAKGGLPGLLEMVSMVSFKKLKVLNMQKINI
jgi:hypothetical protein